MTRDVPHHWLTDRCAWYKPEDGAPFFTSEVVPRARYQPDTGTVEVATLSNGTLFTLSLAAAEDLADNLARQAEYGRHEARRD